MSDALAVAVIDAAREVRRAKVIWAGHWGRCRNCGKASDDRRCHACGDSPPCKTRLRLEADVNRAIHRMDDAVRAYDNAQRESETETTQEIARLLSENPDLRVHISGGSLETMDEATKRQFLADLKECLGMDRETTWT